jgi:hypothetical protein
VLAAGMVIPVASVDDIVESGTLGGVTSLPDPTELLMLLLLLLLQVGSERGSAKTLLLDYDCSRGTIFACAWRLTVGCKEKKHDPVETRHGSCYRIDRTYRTGIVDYRKSWAVSLLTCGDEIED